MISVFFSICLSYGAAKSALDLLNLIYFKSIDSGQ